MPDPWAVQIEALIRLGDDPQTAEYVVNRYRQIVGDDPDALPTPEQARVLSLLTADVIRDARADWYAQESVPAAFKRLLDAQVRPT